MTDSLLVTHNFSTIEVTLLSPHVPADCVADAKRDRFQVLFDHCWRIPFDASRYSDLRDGDHWITRYGYCLNPIVGWLARSEGNGNCVMKIATPGGAIEIFEVRPDVAGAKPVYRYTASQLEADSRQFPSMGTAELAALTRLREQNLLPL